MTIDFRSGIVRILSADRTTAGSGFVLVSQSDTALIATCSHVIQAEPSQCRGEARPRTVSVIFHATGEVASAVVKPEWWRPAEREDVAILALEGPLPAGVTPLPLGSDGGTKGHEFESRGYRLSEQFESGLEATGSIQGVVTHQSRPLLQLRSTQLDHGMSGAPLWDTKRQRVVGMVNSFWGTQRHHDADLAFATPSSTLQEICPPLQSSDICPYRGLSAFTEQDAPFFSGRQVLVANLAERLRQNPRFLAVVGPSGSGKSSVVQAGLLPRLRRGEVRGFDNVCLVLFRPLTEPHANLLRALEAAHVSNQGHSDPFEVVRQRLEREPKQRLVILGDQFEDLFEVTPQNERDEFLSALDGLLNADVSNCFTLIITIRADFYDPVQRSCLGPLLDAGQANVRAMTSTELAEAITAPASLLGFSVQGGLEELMARDLLGTQNPLSLMESALTELWKHRQNGDLKLDYYRAMGGATGAIARWAEEAIQNLTGNQKQEARRILTRLVHFGEGKTPDTRQPPLPVSQLPSPEEDARVLNALADARLLVTDSVDGEATVEIVHDALLHEWPQLRVWIQEDRAFRLWAQRLNARRDEWERTGHAEGTLLSGAPLAEALRWAQQRAPDLTYAERTFIDASSRASRHAKMLRTAPVVVAAIIVLAAIGWRLVVTRTDWYQIRKVLADASSPDPQNPAVRMADAAPMFWAPALAMIGREDEALRLAKTMNPDIGRDTTLMDVADILARRGQADKATALLPMIVNDSGRHIAARSVAVGLAESGLTDKAVAAVRLLNDNANEGADFTEVTNLVLRERPRTDVEKFIEQARTAAEKLHPSDRVVPLENLASVLDQFGRAGQADILWKEARAAADQARDADEARENLAEKLADAGRTVDSEALAHTISDPAYQYKASAHIALALAKTGKSGEARTLIRNSAGLAELIPKSAPRQHMPGQPWPGPFSVKAYALAFAGDVNQAVALIRSEDLHGSFAVEQHDSSTLVPDLADLAAWLAALGEKTSAASVLEKAYAPEILSSSLGADNNNNLETLARILAQGDDAADAISATRRIGDVASRVYALNDLAGLLIEFSSGRNREGEQFCREALAVARQEPNQVAQQVVESLRLLAKAGKVSDALPIAEKIPEAEYRTLAIAEIAALLKKRGELSEAKSLLQQATSSSNDIKNPTERSNALVAIGEAYACLHEFPLARLACDKCDSYDKIRVYSSILMEYAKKGHPLLAQRPDPPI